MKPWKTSNQISTMQHQERYKTVYILTNMRPIQMLPQTLLPAITTTDHVTGLTPAVENKKTFLNPTKKRYQNIAYQAIVKRPTHFMHVS